MSDALRSLNAYIGCLDKMCNAFTTIKIDSLDVFKLSRITIFYGFKNVIEANVKKAKVLDG